MALGDEQIDRLLHGLQSWSDDLLQQLRQLIGDVKVTNTTVLDTRPTETEKAQKV